MQKRGDEKKEGKVKRGGRTPFYISELQRGLGTFRQVLIHPLPTTAVSPTTVTIDYNELRAANHELQLKESPSILS